MTRPNLGKIENFLYLKNSSQLRKKWQKLGIMKMRGITGICTCSCDAESTMYLYVLGYLFQVPYGAQIHM